MAVRTFASAVVLMCVALASFAQGSIRWFSTEYNYGAFKEADGPVSCQFKGVNVAAEPVSLVSARANCGCTTGEIPWQPFATGDTLTITVTYDPEGRPGRFVKKVTIKNSLDEEKTELRISGVVIGTEETLKKRYPVNCGNLRLENDILMFGEVKRNPESASRKNVFITAYNQSLDTIIPQLKGAPSYIRATFIPAVIPPGEQMTATFHFDANECGTWGLLNDSLWLVTDNFSGDSHKIEFTANVVPDFTKLTPGQRMNAPVLTIGNDRLNFGTLNRLGNEVVMPIEVKNEGNSTLEIYRAYSLDEAVTVAVEKSKIKKGKSAQLTLTVNPSLLKGELLNAEVTIITNDPTNSQAKVRLVGELE